MKATAYQLPISDKPATKMASGAWRKQILPISSINYKADGVVRRLDFTKQYLEGLAAAFEDKAYDQVPFQLADKDNTHTMDPERTRGVFTAVEVTDEGLFGYLKPTPAGEQVLRDNPGLGVSVRIVENHERADGKTFPAALQHVLGTLDPRVVAMKPWEPADAVALASGDNTQVVDLTAATFEKGEPMATETALAPDEVERLRALLAADKPDDKTPTGTTTTTTVTDADLTKVIADLEADADADDKTKEIAAANAAKLAQEIALSTTRSTENSVELAEIRKELDDERWKNKKRELLLAGVTPAILNIPGVAELAVGKTAAIELSNGTKVDPGEVLRKVLDECKGQVDLAHVSGSIFGDDSEQARDEATYKAWVAQQPISN